MGTQWRIELLGRLRVKQDGRAITRFRTQKTGALLAYLAYHCQRTHPREVLIELLWPECSLEAGRQSLSMALSSLRHQLEPPGVPAGSVLMADRFSVGLNPAVVSTDVGEFEAAIRYEMRARSPIERAELLARAVETYQGELLPGYYEEWILPQAGRLEEMYFQAAHRLIGLLEKQGDLPRAIQVAQRAIGTAPSREDTYRDLMRLYAAAGQPDAAMRQYKELERLLRQEMGTIPSTITRTLAHEIERLLSGTDPIDGKQKPEIIERPPDPATLPGATTPSTGSVFTIPTGTVIFLMADLEGSPAIQHQAGSEVMANYLELMRHQFRWHGGVEFSEASGSFTVAFAHASDALACALACQKVLTSQRLPEDVCSRPMRMAMVTGEVRSGSKSFPGEASFLATQMLLAGHGGQILCSEETAALLQRDLEAGVRLVDLGVYHLRDMPAPQRLFQIEYPDIGRYEFPSLHAEAGYAGNLPPQFTRFFGREQELTLLEKILLSEEVHLVTLTGPGGSGKTRLALEVAGRLVERLRGAVWFVPLADLSDGRLIADAILEALRAQRPQGSAPLDQVVELLSRRPGLLILDNLEHLLEEGTQIVIKLLERVPELACLVTSRQRLDLAWEREFSVPPLPIPQSPNTPEHLALCESVQLFVDRAQAVRPDFQVTSSNAPTVAELCSRLEGIPLALELAAARVQVLTPAQMLSHIERRFDLLVSRRRDTLERHRTLRGAIDWSYQILSPELRRFFLHLSVFRGGWILEAAEEICDEPMAMDYLAQLRDCSLVIVEGESEIRYRLLDMLRDYGWDRLAEQGESDLLQARHFRYFLQLVEEAELHLVDEMQGEWLQRLDTEKDNLRAAIELGTRNDMESALKLVGMLAGFWYLRGHWAEGRITLAKALQESAGVPMLLRVKALRWAGVLADCEGDYRQAKELLQEVLDLSREMEEPEFIAAALGNLGSVARQQGDYETAQACYEQSLTIRRQIGKTWGVASVLGGLGEVAHDQGNCATAHAYLLESLSLYREMEDKGGVAISLFRLGNVLLDQGDFEAARACYEESLVFAREIGGTFCIGWPIKGLGDVAHIQDDYETAKSFYRESLTVFREIGDKQAIAGSLECFAQVAFAEGAMEQAARLSGAAAMLRELIGSPLPPNKQTEFEWHLENLRQALGESPFASVWSSGRRLTWQQAVSLSLEADDRPFAPEESVPQRIAFGKRRTKAKMTQDISREYRLPDDRWDRINPLLPAPKSKKKSGRPRMDDRQAMTAILYVLQTGCRWKDLPRTFGAPSTVHDRFQEWLQAGVFTRMKQMGLMK